MQSRAVPVIVGRSVEGIRKRRVWPPRTMKEPADAARTAPQRWQEPRAWFAAQLFVCLLLLVAIPGARSAFAQSSDDVSAGTLMFESGSGLTAAPRLNTDVRMEVSGIIARVEVRQQFRNDSDQWVEGVYAFPLPENAAVNQMRMEVGERVIVGEIREKAEAQQLFEQARNNGQRASVVHQQRPNIFRTAVANIGPHETINVTIAYLQIVEQQGGRYSLRFPLTITPRYVPGVLQSEAATATSETPVAQFSPSHGPHELATLADLQPAFMRANAARQSVSFAIELDAGVAIQNISSAFHAISVASEGGTYRVNLASGQVAPDRDFELAWTPIVQGGPATALFREQTAAGEHVLLMFMPPQERAAVTTPREVIFIIDTSGSMSGSSIEQARNALLSGLSTLGPKDRFNLIQFNSVHESLFEAPVDASFFNLERARNYVRRLESTGGTEMLPALSAAVSMPRSKEHLRQILFITDGAVSNEEELMSVIRDRLGDARLFTVGIGSAPNGYFMRTAARLGRGTFTYIGATNEVEQKMNALVHKLTHPVLTGIELHWPNGAIPEYAPAEIGDLYADEPLVISARLQGASQGMLMITGRTGGAWTRQIVPDPKGSHPGVATLWARNRIGDLIDTQIRRVPDADIRAQVLPVALEYQLVSKYTSLIAIDKTPVRRPDEALDSKRIENTKPDGQNWEASGMPSTATPADLKMIVGALALMFATLVFFSTRRRNART